MGEMEIAKCVDSRNLRLWLKSGSRNRIPNLGIIHEQSRSSGSNQCWPRSNYSEKQCMIWEHQSNQFCDEYANMNYPYNANVDYSGNWSRDNMRPIAPESNGGGDTCPGEIIGMKYCIANAAIFSERAKFAKMENRRLRFRVCPQKNKRYVQILYVQVKIRSAHSRRWGFNTPSPSRRQEMGREAYARPEGPDL